MGTILQFRPREERRTDFPQSSGEVTSIQVPCPKCRDGYLYKGTMKLECPYCAGEARVEPEVAVAIRECDREMYVAFWCDCTTPSDEVRIRREGIYCAVCNKMIQEES